MHPLQVTFSGPAEPSCTYKWSRWIWNSEKLAGRGDRSSSPSSVGDVTCFSFLDMYTILTSCY